jgi:hypothetical protein
MTIKQQGGIFGRNPTFNDVTVDGTLTSNSISLTSLDDVPIGSSTPSTGAFTTLDANSGTFGQQSTGSGLLTGTSDEFSVGLNQDNGNTSNTQIWNAFTNGASSATYQVRYRSANDTGTAAVRFQVNGATGDATINNGNLIIGTSGKGIDFSATAGTGTSELFEDYEEGNWTPSQGGGLTVVGAFASSGTYTKIGRQVSVIGEVTGATSIAFSSGGAILTGGLPFNAATYGAGQAFNGALSAGMIIAAAGGSSIYGAGTISANSRISFQLTYLV